MASAMGYMGWPKVEWAANNRFPEMDLDGDGQVGSPKMLADDTYLPGDLGFDPLGFYKGTDQHKRTMQLKELNNGRLAMVAITYFAVSEFVTKGTVMGVFSL